MIRTALSIVALVLASALAAVEPAHGQGVGVIRVTPSGDVPLAAPPSKAVAGATSEADTVYRVMWRDLEMSGYFKMQRPESYVEKGKGVELGTFDFSAWEMIDTTVLVKTRVHGSGDPGCAPEGQRVCADLFVYYVPTQGALAVKRFRGTAESARHLGHAMANHVLLVTTGTRGHFGSRLVAVGTHTGNKEVYVLETDGQGVRPVTRNGSINLSPAWSPDGAEIAWTSYKRANPDLYVKNLATGHTRMISSVKGVNTSPAFSPDGRHLAMSRSVASDSDVFVLDAKTGSELHRLTTGGGIDVSPSYSPDGTQVALASERAGGAQVYLVSVDSGESKRVTFNGDFNIDPVISPDGKRIAFVGRSKGGFDIYVVGIDGRGMIRLTQDMSDNEDPTWSPDSRYVVFSSTRTGRSELWMSTADGRHQSQVTQGGGWTQPSWAPALE
ncbi:MAG: hypothetical protein KTR31_15550 [Myxococcales bacterium]|nr:hypothetical protein [Myxococcales bacterium]